MEDLKQEFFFLQLKCKCYDCQMLYWSAQNRISEYFRMVEFNKRDQKELVALMNRLDENRNDYEDEYKEINEWEEQIYINYLKNEIRESNSLIDNYPKLVKSAIEYLRKGDVHDDEE